VEIYRTETMIVNKAGKPKIWMIELSKRCTGYLVSPLRPYYGWLFKQNAMAQKGPSIKLLYMGSEDTLFQGTVEPTPPPPFLFFFLYEKRNKKIVNKN